MQLLLIIASVAVQRAPLEAELVANVGQQAADVVLSLLTPHPPDRRLAEAALQLPFFLPESLQPSGTSLAVAECTQQPAGLVSGGVHRRPVLLSVKEAEAKPSSTGSMEAVFVTAIGSADGRLQSSADVVSPLQYSASQLRSKEQQSANQSAGDAGREEVGQDLGNAHSEVMVQSLLLQ